MIRYISRSDETEHGMIEVRLMSADEDGTHRVGKFLSHNEKDINDIKELWVFNPGIVLTLLDGSRTE